MIGTVLQFLMWLILAATLLFLVANGGLRLAAWTGDHWAEREAIAFANQHASEFAHLRAFLAPRAPLMPA